jgi:hypothetical protein
LDHSGWRGNPLATASGSVPSDDEPYQSSPELNWGNCFRKTIGASQRAIKEIQFESSSRTLIRPGDDGFQKTTFARPGFLLRGTGFDYQVPAKSVPGDEPNLMSETPPRVFSQGATK